MSCISSIISKQWVIHIQLGTLQVDSFRTICFVLSHPVGNGSQTAKPSKRGLEDDQQKGEHEADQGENGHSEEAVSQQGEEEQRQLQHQEGSHHEIDGRRVNVFVDARRSVREKDVVAIHEVFEHHIHQTCTNPTSFIIPFIFIDFSFQS